MFESEIMLALVIGGWILYELYGSWFLAWAPWIRIGGGVAVIAYLYWQMRESPEQFQDTLTLAKELLTHNPTTGSGTTKEKRNVTNAMKKIVGAKYEWKCAGCKSTLDEGYQVDHIIPLFKNGTNHIDNLQPLCGTCHNKKSIRERVGV
jgi:predicted HNH restriction endonuclease